jgi:chemotaxis protein methyltransferase CheR
METGLLQRFIQLITAYTGLHIRGEEMEKLRHTIRSRMTEQQLTNPEAYYQLLASDIAASRREWEELVRPLTIGETYFFRDSGQCSLLRDRILPELIERNHSTRSLRIWSAGCSTGEEPYSLAIFVHELLPTHKDWNIVIFGTDVNKDAIATARHGIYRQHSLRTLGEELRNRYFHQYRGHWELDERFRSMVSFHQVNLLKDLFPNSTANLADMDLILCRNVFIYFDRAAVTRVVTKFTNTLKMGGYLVTGHAELHDQQPSGLFVRNFPESVIYQRHSAGTPAPEVRSPQTPPANVPPLAPKPVPQAGSVLRTPFAVSPMRPPRHTLAKGPSTTMRAGAHDPSQVCSSSMDDLYRQARGYADAGNYEAARRYCQVALSRDSLAEKPYYLLAQIAEVQGDLSAAKNFLKKILYLSPGAVSAHLELGALYTRENDLLRARRMFKVALEQLKTLPADAVIEPFADLSAAQLLPEVQRRLEQLSCTSHELS